MYDTAPLGFEDITFNLGDSATSKRPEDGICSRAPPRSSVRCPHRKIPEEVIHIVAHNPVSISRGWTSGCGD
ncbi:hypothetical protein P170DRAFT_191978 [Aspergillus steynii IBT 23096]|uniref:Uncharacterized protein n=1 Tax=Aspergillus steynii IBT 23096 TaxID=1392250 RepID=A0A2I2GA10_9EURO|nr:uncharacterized protein P170DRAFT_191978 [Aspergillus steynii IBT 23096]PLB49712.1 hypothetical protein P170DRAFT_191978 [Aspergillus steynii IBT 23096]